MVTHKKRLSFIRDVVRVPIFIQQDLTFSFLYIHTHLCTLSHSHIQILLHTATKDTDTRIE